jgi:hypothetical protein
MAAGSGDTIFTWLMRSIAAVWQRPQAPCT